MLDTAVYDRFRDNELVFGMFYFPEYFRRESPGFHLKILKEAKLNANLAVQAPRGSAKSVILGFLMATHDIVFKRSHFNIIVMDTYGKAAGALENIKSEFRTNEKLKEHYGIRMRKDAEGDTIFVHPDGFECRVLCKGADQIGSIRGERFGAYRPQRVLIDDLENDTNVKNPELRADLERRFNDVIKYAGDSDTKIIILGTILHDDSLMAKLVSKERYLNFRKMFFKALYIIEGKKVSLWPARWSVSDLEKMEEDDPEGFAKEMMGDPSSGSMESFKREDFRLWRFENNNVLLFDRESNVIARYNIEDCRAAIACDLAWEEKKISDFTVIMPGFLTPNNEVLIDTYIEKRGLKPDEFEEIIFNMEARLEALTRKRVAIGFEKAKLEKVMKWLLGKAMKNRNKYLWFIDLQWDGDKIQRILTRLSNRYAQHVIFHKPGMGSLENQLIRLVSATHDDCADAASGLVQIFDRLGKAPAKKTVNKDNIFNWWKKNATNINVTSKKPYHIGTKSKKSLLIPARKAFN